MTATPRRFERNSENFPILYEGYGIRIFRNPCHEIFIEDVESGAAMRLNRSHYPGGGLMFTAAQDRVDPISINGMIGWRIYKTCAR